MRLLIRDILFTLALAAPLAAHADSSMIRVVCEDYDAGAEVTVNGTFKGECPIDFQVAPGMLKLRVAKKIDNEFERVFEQEIRVGDGVVKKVEAVLIKQLNTKAYQKCCEGPIAEVVTGANNGIAFDQQCLGDRYYNNYKDAESQAEGVRWWRKAAEQGYAPAQKRLGQAYDFGKGLLTADKKEALRWYRMAAAQGNGDAQCAIAYMYERGDGVNQDFNESIKWHRAAASQGDSCGFSGMGRAYEYGYGVQRDAEEAIRLYRKAKALGEYPGILDEAIERLGGKSAL